MPDMWTRRELKEKGKTAFKANYWKTVLVSMLIMLTGIGAFSRGGSGSRIGRGGRYLHCLFSSGPFFL